MDWYYQEDGVQVGPLTEDEFEDRVKVGRIGPSTLVWNETMTGWQPYAGMKAQAAPPPVRAAERNAPAVACSQCLRQFPQNDMIHYGESWICASCKPLFFQKLKEGGAVSGVYVYGDFWPRVAAKLIDGLILGLVYGIFVALGIVIAITFPQNEMLQAIVTLIGYAVYFVAAVGFNAYFLPRYGATPGKMALGLKVIGADGENISTGKAVGRYFAELLSGMMCYIGYIMVAFDEERRSLHDRLCTTWVVKK